MGAPHVWICGADDRRPRVAALHRCGRVRLCGGVQDTARHRAAAAYVFIAGVPAQAAGLARIACVRRASTCASGARIDAVALRRSMHRGRSGRGFGRRNHRVKRSCM